MLFCITAAAAYPCTPLAEIDIPPPALNPDDDEQPARPGTDAPEFPPGAVVTANGTRFDSGAATPITLRWGSLGPVIATVPINIDGSWTVKFRLPEGIPDGRYVIYAEAFDANGELIEGLPARRSIEVFSPRIAEASGDPVAPRRTVRAPGATIVQTPASQPKKRAATRSAGKPGTVTRTAPAAAPKKIPVAPLPLRAVAPPIVAAPPTSTGPIAHVHRVAPGAAVESAPLEKVAPGPRVESAPLPDAATPGAAPALPVVATEEDNRRPTWLLLVLGAVGILFLGAAAGGLVIARRWPPVSPTDPVEAELQEIISEQRVREEELTPDR